MVKAKPLNKSKNKMSRKNMLITGISAIIIIAVGVLGFFVFKNSNTTEVEKTTEKITSTTAYKEIESAVTFNEVKPGSITIAPATKMWWGKLALMSPYTSLTEVNFDDIDDNALYVSFTNSKGGNYKSELTAGVPTTMITYKSQADLSAPVTKLRELGYGVTASGNTAIIVPEGAYSDLDYSISALETKMSGDDPLKLDGKGYWSLNAEEFEAIFMDDLNDNDKSAYKKIVTALAGNTNLNWVGTSTDGENWDGQIIGWDASKFVSPSDFMSKLYWFRDYMVTGKDISYDPSAMDDPNYTGSGDRQSLMGCCMVISTPKEISAPTITIPEDSPYYKQITKDEGLMRIVFTPNNVYTALIAVEPYSVTQINTAVITIKDLQGNASIRITNEFSYDPEKIGGVDAKDGQNVTEETDETK